MPRTKRDHLKRALANAISYTQDATSWVFVLHEQFVGVHEDYAAYLGLIIMSQCQTKAMLEDLWKKAFGTENVSWEAYTTVRGAFYPKQLETVGRRTQHGKGRLKKPSEITESES